MFGQATSLVLLFASSVLAQVPGPLTPEVHPSLTSYKCTKIGGCKAVNSSIVLDSNYRWLHTVNGYTNCVNTGFDKDICPDVETCAKNCALEGVDYSGYGVSTSGNAVTMNIYIKKNNVSQLSSPRIYLLEDDNTYDQFKLLNQEFSFDVDVSNVPCGINGALYFSEMNEKGDQSTLNTAGAKYGTGYCDAQCPVQNFVKGRANLNQTYGACCNEMDIWEANNAAQAYTPHPCNATQVYACSGDDCGSGDKRTSSVCDKDGCDINPYRMGNKNFYGWGANYSVDTGRKFTVVTQFLTTDNTANGTLKEIRRLYVQDGKVVQNAKVNVPGFDKTDSLTDSYCQNERKVFGGTDTFTQRGGLKQMGSAIRRGMVLAMAIWEDSTSYMQWLDSTSPPDAAPGTLGAERGPCPTTSGRPADNIANHPDAKVVFSNIKSGDIGSTFSNATTTASRLFKKY